MSKIDEKRALELLEEFTRLGQLGVDKARAENHRLGLPNIMERDGEVIYELPDGTITKEKPEAYKRTESD